MSNANVWTAGPGAGAGAGAGAGSGSGVGPAPVFAALGDRTRLALLAKLSDGRGRSITELAADSRITRQAVSKHLRVLEDAGLVSSRRVGRESRFTYREGSIAPARAYLDTVAAQWDSALARLRAWVEG